MQVIVYRGIPGSGKSTHQRENFPRATVVSADHHFMVPCVNCKGTGHDLAAGARLSCRDCKGTKKVYQFDATKLSEAHTNCLRKFVNLVLPWQRWAAGQAPRAWATNGEPHTDPGSHAVLVVDNTGTTVAEIAPYVELARAYEHAVKVVTVLCDPATAAKRCVHAVLLKNIFMADLRLREHTALLPSWWPHEVVAAPTEAEVAEDRRRSNREVSNEEL